MDTIYEIDGSENYTQKLQQSPKVELLSFRSLRKEKEEDSRRVLVRQRSRSDSSDYLIFSFLERSVETYIILHSVGVNESN